MIEIIISAYPKLISALQWLPFHSLIHIALDDCLTLYVIYRVIFLVQEIWKHKIQFTAVVQEWTETTTSTCWTCKCVIVPGPASEMRERKVREVRWEKEGRENHTFHMFTLSPLQLQQLCSQQGFLHYNQVVFFICFWRQIPHSHFYI